eukprot:GHVT01076254.1.p1 GENE.GHVT01076254.1~~GHVT01076254.1.p1  ORF type:complete len:319 (+),score=78.91 GHVT01076254.1:1005-1961(+)
MKTHKRKTNTCPVLQPLHKIQAHSNVVQELRFSSSCFQPLARGVGCGRSSEGQTSASEDFLRSVFPTVAAPFLTGPPLPCGEFWAAGGHGCGASGEESQPGLDLFLLSAGCDGCVAKASLQQGKLAWKMQAHNFWTKALDTLIHEPPLFLTAGNDGTVKLWDERQLHTAAATAFHNHQASARSPPTSINRHHSPSSPRSTNSSCNPVAPMSNLHHPQGCTICSSSASSPSSCSACLSSCPGYCSFVSSSLPLASLFMSSSSIRVSPVGRLLGAHGGARRKRIKANEMIGSRSPGQSVCGVSSIRSWPPYCATAGASDG